MRAKVTLFARVKDVTRSSGYRFETVQIKRGRPVAIATSTAFYLRFTANGRRVVKPVGNDLETAFIAYENHSRNLPALQRGESQEPLASDTSGLTLREALQTYLQELANGKSAATISSYRHALDEFAQHRGENTLVQKIDRPCLLAYKNWLYSRDLNESTIHARLLRVMIFLKHCGVGKLLRRGDWPRPNQRVPEAYTQAEIDLMMAATGPDPDSVENLNRSEERLLIEFFLASGARNAEVQHAVKGDIRISSNGAAAHEVALLTIRAKPELGWRTKSKRDRTVRLPLDFTKRLLAARTGCSDDDLLFPNSQGGCNRHFDVILKRVTERAGIGGRIDLHKFRATFATRLHAQGVPIQDVQKMLGHRDVATTMRYLAATAHESEATGKAIEAAFAGR